MYHILQRFEGRGSREITDSAYSYLSPENKKMYYKDEDDTYIPTSSPSIYEDDVVADISIGVITDDLLSNSNIDIPSTDNDDSFGGFDGGSFGGGGSSGDW